MSRSKEEAIAAGVKIAETQHNMKRRKPWHNYNRKGTYMLTLVVEGRHAVLGKVVAMPAGDAAGVVDAGDAARVMDAGDAARVMDAGGMVMHKLAAHVELTELGKAIRDEEQKKIHFYYKMVEIWKLCIMPDHIHMIVRVNEDMPEGKHLGDVVRGFKVGCTRAWWRLTGMRMPAGEAVGVVVAGDAAKRMPAGVAAGVVDIGDAAGVVDAGDVAGVVEMGGEGNTMGSAITTPAVSPAGKKLPVLFESGYNDLILLEDGQLDNWIHYLDDNPRRLAVKRQHPDYFTTMHHVDIGEWHCQMVGNRFLLNIPQKVAVIVHKAYSDKVYADYKRKWLACGEAGGILVSAAIAAHEKEVMREAMDRGYRIIFVRENGFPSLYKPSGESFDACSEGRLLQVSPWEYHMQRRTISREQCLMLNRLVEEIVRRTDF